MSSASGSVPSSPSSASSSLPSPELHVSELPIEVSEEDRAAAAEVKKKANAAFSSKRFGCYSLLPRSLPNIFFQNAILSVPQNCTPRP